MFFVAFGCFAACAILAVVANKCTTRGQRLQVQGASARQIVPYVFGAAFAGLGGFGLGVYGIFLIVSAVYRMIA